MSSEDAAFLDALLRSMTGVTVSTSVADHEALAGAEVSLGRLRQAVGGDLDRVLSLAEAAAVLAAASTASGDGDAASALTKLSTDFANVLGEVRLSDVLTVLDGASDSLTLPLGRLLLDLLAQAQLDYAEMPGAVALSAQALTDLMALDAATMTVWTVTGGETVIGSTGAQARSPHLRVELVLTPVDASTMLGLGALGSAELSLEPLTIVLDIASSTTTITSISATEVTVETTPGIVTVYLGAVTRDAFLDRTSNIDPATDLVSSPIANLEIAILAPLVMGEATVRARGATAITGAPSTLVFDGPFPETQRGDAGAGFLDASIASVLEDLDVEVTGYASALGLTLVDQALVEDAVTDLLRTGTSPLVAILDDVLDGVVDEALMGLGARLGAVDVRVSALSSETSGIACNAGGEAGRCHANACCTGCWDGASCVGGANDAACGRAGETCTACDDSLACTGDSCDAGACTHPVVEGCAVASMCFAGGEANPANACQVCEPARSTVAWSAASRRECLVDSDGDGIPDVEEDANGNGDLDDDDSDGDGIPDYLDPTDDPGSSDNVRFAARGGALCSTSARGAGTGSIFPLTFALVVLLAGARARAKRGVLAYGAAVVLSALGGARARAQPMVNVQRYALPATPSSSLALTDTSTLGHLRFTGALSLDYALNALVLEVVDASGSRQIIGGIVEQQLYAQLAFALGLGDRSLVWLRVPFAPVLRGDDSLGGLSADVATAGGAAFSDVALGGRFALVGSDADAFALSAQLTLTLPTAVGSRYAGERTVTGTPELAMRVRISRLQVRGTVGARIRKPTSIENIELGSELTFGAGVAVLAFDGTRDLTLGLDLFGATSLRDFGARGSVPVEVLAGATVFGKSGFQGSVGVGPGISRGYGTPDVRALAMVGYVRPEHAPAPTSVCALGAEDLDGFEDEDGCADPDNDHDEVLDAEDACAREAEDMDGFEDADGCPDLDDDGDGIADARDACPHEAEDMDGFEDEDGCPEADNDRDGILDAADACPRSPEDLDGVRDDDGCPETDADDDGFLDAVDRCPLERESRNGVDDEDGCPDHIRVDLSSGRIAVMEPVFFAANSDRILARSFPMLDEIAALMLEREDLGRVAVEGHTDDRGPDARNLSLSERRATSVVRYLVGRGVPTARLEAHGYGEANPVAENRTNEGRARNRRVEFNILGTDTHAPQEGGTP